MIYFCTCICIFTSFMSGVSFGLDEFRHGWLYLALTAVNGLASLLLVLS